VTGERSATHRIARAFRSPFVYVEAVRKLKHYNNWTIRSDLHFAPFCQGNPRNEDATSTLASSPHPRPPMIRCHETIICVGLVSLCRMWRMGTQNLYHLQSREYQIRTMCTCFKSPLIAKGNVLKYIPVHPFLHWGVHSIHLQFSEPSPFRISCCIRWILY
jgi:hypothetical protein